MSLKKIYLLLILFPGLIFSDNRPDIGPDEIDAFGDMCPKKEALNGKSGKFGHTVVLVDTTTSLSNAQSALLDRIVFDERILKKIPPYDRLSILNLTGNDIQASQTKYIFSKCRPRNGDIQSSYDLDKPTFWVPEKRLKRNWNLFIDDLEKAKDSLFSQKTGSFTQLMEMLKELSRLPDLQFDDSYQTRKLIIVSDLLQYSDNVNFIASCVRKNKCVTWKRLKERKSLKNWLDTSSPDFGSYKPEVEIIYLNSNNDPKLNIGLLELWDGFFEDIGISSIKKEAETSTSF